MKSWITMSVVPLVLLSVRNEKNVLKPVRLQREEPNDDVRTRTPLRHSKIGVSRRRRTGRHSVFKKEDKQVNNEYRLTNDTGLSSGCPLPDYEIKKVDYKIA